MKLSYTEAKERFGIRYTSLGNAIKETFNHDGYLSSSKDVVEEKVRLMNQANARYQSKIKQIDDFVNRKSGNKFEALLRFVFKAKTNKSVLKAKQKAQEEYDEDVRNISQMIIQHIPQNDVEVEFADLKVGQDIFIITEIDNVLDVGFYKGTITCIKYYFVDEDTFPIARIEATANVGDRTFNLKINRLVDENRLSTHYTGHTVFTDEKEAKESFNAMLNNKIENLKKLMIEE